MKRYTKKDITFHDDGFFAQTGHAAINVKVYHWLMPWERRQIQEQYGWTDEEMEQAARAVWDWLQYEFWNTHVPLLAKKHKVEDLAIGSAGRSDGWVCAENATVEAVRSWNAIQVSRWGRFEQAIRGAVQAQTSIQTAKAEFAYYAEKEKSHV